mmetsp:Transcript_50256/g.82167  ORF Transcript_50256/g.82167 Transcript_50256/m.82167 type:complete len:86 (-) Transcript_50256:91-348(-)
MCISKRAGIAKSASHVISVDASLTAPHAVYMKEVLVPPPSDPLRRSVISDNISVPSNEPRLTLGKTKGSKTCHRPSSYNCTITTL